MEVCAKLPESIVAAFSELITRRVQSEPKRSHQSRNQLTISLTHLSNLIERDISISQLLDQGWMRNLRIQFADDIRQDVT